MDTRAAQRAGAPWTLPDPQKGATGDIDLGGAPSASRGATMIANRNGSEQIAPSGGTLVRAAATAPSSSRQRLFNAAAIPIVNLLVKLLQGINDVIELDDD